MKYVVFNQTDGIMASPGSFDSKEKRKWVVINQNKYMLLLHNVKDLPQYDIFKKVPKKLVNAIEKVTKAGNGGHN